MIHQYWTYMAEGNFSKSQAASVNFLFNEGNIYISDNHLCALWGWLQQCDKKEEYTFIHIDHHNDLKMPSIIDWIYKIKETHSFEEFLEFRYIPERTLLVPYVAWDTYIKLAEWLYPKWFTEVIFLTKECPYPNTFDACRQAFNEKCYRVDSTVKLGKNLEFSCDLERILKNIKENVYPHNVILNLDIDYFFDCGEYVRDAYWSDEKIDKVAELLKTAMESGNVQVLTIAMSPECCSEDGKSNGKPSYQPSWGIMERLLRILTDNAKKEFITIMQEKTDINKNSQINENKN